MLGIGFWEIVLILLIAFIALGHEGFIEAAKKVGRWLRAMQRELAEVRKDVEDIENKITDELNGCGNKNDSQQIHREDRKNPPT
jgi:Sec-independent protein translocase protein TatA